MFVCEQVGFMALIGHSREEQMVKSQATFPSSTRTRSYCGFQL